MTQQAPINKTQSSCLTIEFNIVSSFSGLKQADSATRPHTNREPEAGRQRPDATPFKH
jgi:hypothetical protein